MQRTYLKCARTDHREACLSANHHLPLLLADGRPRQTLSSNLLGVN